MHADTPLGAIYVSYVNNRIKEEVLLLVHGESGIDRMEDLKGRSLVVHRNPRASLARPWMDTVLGEKLVERTAAVLQSALDMLDRADAARKVTGNQ